MATGPFVNEISLVDRNINQCINDFQIDANSSLNADIQKSIQLTETLLARAQQLQTAVEHRQQLVFDKLIQNAKDKYTLAQMTDQAFRSKEFGRSADQLIHILDVQGIPRFFSPMDRALMRGFQSFGDWLPGVSMPMVQGKMRKETSNVILPAERDELSEHLQNRQSQGIHMNVNMLGEALLGEDDAQQRLNRYQEILSWPSIEHISVKISTIYSQIHAVSRDHSIDILAERLDTLYSTAMEHEFTDNVGRTDIKFVYLDMEEFRDLHITVDAFMETLNRPHLQQARAGIVLQAYIPDSYTVQQKLTAWAEERCKKGARPITMRIVKGANMEMEKVEASVAVLTLPTYKEKVHTDANFKRMLNYGMEHLQAVKLGVASHNLFDVSYAMVRAHVLNAWTSIQFEMLEGMANHQRRAIQECAVDILLYAPACRQQEFTNAIGYLIRRLDENTGPNNFLRYTFNLKPNDESYKRLKQGFIDSFDTTPIESIISFRNQDRQLKAPQPPSAKHWWNYINEADTDFSLPHNSRWAKHIVEAWREKALKPITVPAVINGNIIMEKRSYAEHHSPLNPKTIASVTTLADDKDIDQAITCAVQACSAWSDTHPSERRDTLREVAQLLREHRSELIGIAMLETGKILQEADAEINEAIDFIEFYAANMLYYHDLDGISTESIGPVCVIPPWNFPIAIPCGGIAAALAAGNSVILKPAPQSCASAYQLCTYFWQAGVDKKLLQFAPCAEDSTAKALLTDSRISAHVLTGASSTARLFYDINPNINLYAETGGKNAIIVTAMADRDLAIKCIIQSAFGHAGQKCSACSLLLLEEEVYEDKEFQRALCDATKSLTVNIPWELHGKVNPLISSPNEELDWAFNNLEDDEYWLLKPEQKDQHNQCLWSPGIKYNVKQSARTATTELFGPVLSVLSVKTLNQAIDIVNDSAYGLTSGLQSLDDREQAIWKERIQAGNLYINRAITGAIVLRQPFGGIKASSFGPGMKAGGPNYLTQFLKFSQSSGENFDRREQDNKINELLTFLQPRFPKLNHGNLRQAAESYLYWSQTEFKKQHDHVRLIGQDNFRYYKPVQNLVIRYQSEQDIEQLLYALLCIISLDIHCCISIDDDIGTDHIQIIHEATQSWAYNIECVVENENELLKRISNGDCQRLRWIGAERPNLALQTRCNQYHCHIESRQACLHGRIDGLFYLLEQSLSQDYHRYGNLGARQYEDRQDLAEK